MPADLRLGPDSRPTDELASGEAALWVLQQVLHTIANDMSPADPVRRVRQTSEYTDALEGQVVAAARMALDAWHRRVP